MIDSNSLWYVICFVWGLLSAFAVISGLNLKA